MEIERVEFDGYVRTKNTMDAIDGDKIIFWELVPNNGAGIYPAVLVIPGSGNQGARDLVGEPSSVSQYYYQSEMAVHLAMAGYAVYVPELRGYGERAVNTEWCKHVASIRESMTGCHETILRNQMARVGLSINTYRESDIAQVLAHMVSLEYVDRNRIATAGLSLGAGFSQIISIYNPDLIMATVVASGVASNFHSPPSLQAVGDGELLCCDSNEMIAAIAPRPLYVSHGAGERGSMLWEAETGHTAEFLRRVYSMLEAEDNFTYVVHGGGHEYDIPSVLEFLDRHLRRMP